MKGSFTNIENKCKRFLSLLLALAMVISLMPPIGHVHAEGEETVVTLEKVTAMQANEEYVIFFSGTNRAMANSTRTWAKGAGMDTGVISAPSANYLWTLVPVDDVADGYMLYNSAAAKYITVSQNNAAPNETSGDVFKFTHTENCFVIKAEGVEYGYFNNLGGENIVGGWNSDGTKFDVYKVVELTLSEAELPGKAFWTKVSVDTETVYDASEGLFEYAWDNNPATIWHSNWQNGVSDKLDAEGETFTGVIDFGAERSLPEGISIQ